MSKVHGRRSCIPSGKFNFDYILAIAVFVLWYKISKVHTKPPRCKDVTLKMGHILAMYC